MHSFAGMLLVFCLLLPSAHLHETCEEELAREHAEDVKIHECRSCEQLEVDPDANCPVKGFDCDPALPMHSKVLSSGSNDCSELRCADSNATLFVGGERAPKVTCADKQWNSAKDTIAESGVCGRKCGVPICQTARTDFLSDKLLPFDVKPPDASHPCAWGSCPDGAMAGNSVPDHPYNGLVEFSCTGNRNWIMSDGNKFAHVACMKKQCETLVPEISAKFCGQIPNDNKPYTCYDPTFVDDESGTAEKRMRCDDPNALRYTDDNKVVNPVCSLGKWTNNEMPISKDTKVMCISCPPVLAGFEGEDGTPEISKKEVTCQTKNFLTVGLYKPPTIIESTLVKVDWLKCSDKFVWDAELKWGSAGGKFTQFTTLSSAIEAGVSFEVHCYDKLPES